VSYGPQNTVFDSRAVLKFTVFEVFPFQPFGFFPPWTDFFVLWLGLLSGYGREVSGMCGKLQAVVRVGSYSLLLYGCLG